MPHSCCFTEDRVKREVRLVGWALLLAVICSGQARAQTPEIKVSLSEMGVMDSNPLMQTTNVKELSGLTTTPRLTLLDQTLTSKLSLSAWVENSIYNRSEFNTTDAHAMLDYTHQMQRTDFGLKVLGDSDTTRTSEVTMLATETTLIHHLAIAFAPTVGYMVSPISKLELTGNYYKSAYDNSLYVNYHTISVNPSYIRNFSEKYAGVFGINARRYESEQGPRKITDSIGPSAGIKAKLTPKLTANARAGREASRQEVQGVITQAWTWNTVFSGDLTFAGDQDSFKVSATREQQAYGNGSDSILTSLGVNEEYRISPLFSVSAGASYQFTDAGQANGTDLDVQYSGNAGFAYHVTEMLDLSTMYRYRNKAFINRPDKAEESVARMGLSYHPQIDEFF